MKKFVYIFITFAFIILVAIVFSIVFKSLSTANNSSNIESTMENNLATQMVGDVFKLPEPKRDGKVSLEKALTLRRSTRSYKNQPISLQELSQLLWSAQGITNERGFKTAPSAGATFPLEMYVVVNNVTNLKKGIYQYFPEKSQIKMLKDKDVSSDLMRACLSQSMIKDAGVVLVFGAIFERTTARYGERGRRYVYNEIGHASQNVHLQAAVLNLGTVVIGAYRDDDVEEILNLGEDIRVLYLMPVGKM